MTLFLFNTIKLYGKRPYRSILCPCGTGLLACVGFLVPHNLPPYVLQPTSYNLPPRRKAPKRRPTLQCLYMPAIQRRASVPVNIAGVWVGGNHPIVVQSMTNTDTADV